LQEVASSSASKITYIVSGGALNCTSAAPKPSDVGFSEGALYFRYFKVITGNIVPNTDYSKLRIIISQQAEQESRILQCN